MWKRILAYYSRRAISRKNSFDSFMRGVDAQPITHNIDEAMKAIFILRSSGFEPDSLTISYAMLPALQAHYIKVLENPIKIDPLHGLALQGKYGINNFCGIPLKIRGENDAV